MPEPILWYFADPMCSWCWGFSPVFKRVLETYRDKCRMALVMGGLRPGTEEPITAEFRDEILHHWRDVQKKTGQSFSFEGAMPDGFIYDTEPPSRAVLAVGTIMPEQIFPYFRSIQAAFYTQNRDVVNGKVLAELAQAFDITAEEFNKEFDNDETRNKVQQHFRQAREFGVRGFPTLVIQDESGYQAVSRGYALFEDIAKEIDKWLDNKT